MNSDTLDIRWRYIMDKTENAVITSLHKRDLAASYAIMLNGLRHDRHINGEVILGMVRAPASKQRHHDYEGGLVKHLLEMEELWRGTLLQCVRDMTPGHMLLDDSSVWLAILHHDLNKVHRYKLVSKEPWSVDYYESQRTKLLGEEQSALSILSEYNISVSPMLHNALICAEGGHADYKPKAETVLARIVQVLDLMSSDVIDRLRTNRFWDSLAGGLDAKDETL